jgi:hypothetical protein
MNEVRAVTDMAVIRAIGAVLEIIAAVFMYRFGSVSTALKINALLGIIGPAVLLAVSALGLVGIAVQLSPAKVGMVTVGVLLILLGAR